MNDFDSIDAPWWDDKPILVVANGPSLNGHDLSRLKGLGHVIAVKGAMFDIDWADIGFGIDLPRLREWLPSFKEVPYPVWWAIPDDRPHIDVPDNLHLLRRMRDINAVNASNTIYCGGTSGLGALMFALAKIGPNKAGKKIFLFGFDFKPTNGEWHTNDRHYRVKRVQRAHNWSQWASRFEDVASVFKMAGVKVYNVSPDSLVTAFPRISFDDAVNALHSGDLDETLNLDRIRAA